MIQRHEEDYWHWDYSCPHCSTKFMATGCHETDQGEQECKVCKELFEIEIEYDPSCRVSTVEGEE